MHTCSQCVFPPLPVAHHSILRARTNHHQPPPTIPTYTHPNPNRDTYPTNIRQTSDGYPTRIRRPSDAYPTLIRRFSDAYPTPIRRLSDADPSRLLLFEGPPLYPTLYPTPIRRLSDAYPTPIRRLSDAYPTPIRRPSDAHPTPVRRSSSAHAHSPYARPPYANSTPIRANPKPTRQQTATNPTPRHLCAHNYRTKAASSHTSHPTIHCTQTWSLFLVRICVRQVMSDICVYIYTHTHAHGKESSA